MAVYKTSEAYLRGTTDPKIDIINGYHDVPTEDAATDADGFYLSINAGVTNDFKITYTEDADEGAAKNIPYSVIYEQIEA